MRAPASNDASFVLTNSSLTRSTGGAFTLFGLDQASLRGGAGNNTLNAAAFTLGTVTLNGRDGNDLLRGGEGADTLDGGAGDDDLGGGDDDDVLSGGPGTDMCDGADGHADTAATDCEQLDVIP